MVMIIIVIIIISSWYSQRVAKNFKQNPVAMQDTVLLLSYSKIFKAIIVPLSSTLISLQTIHTQTLAYILIILHKVKDSCSCVVSRWKVREQVLEFQVP